MKGMHHQAHKNHPLPIRSMLTCLPAGLEQTLIRTQIGHKVDAASLVDGRRLSQQFYCASTYIARFCAVGRQVYFPSAVAVPCSPPSRAVAAALVAELRIHHPERFSFAHSR